MSVSPEELERLRVGRLAWSGRRRANPTSGRSELQRCDDPGCPVCRTGPRARTRHPFPWASLADLPPCATIFPLGNDPGRPGDGGQTTPTPRGKRP